MNPTSAKTAGKSYRIGAAIALLAIGAVSLAASFRAVWGEPFQYGWLGRNGARYGITARNFVRLPLAETHGAPCLVSGTPDAEDPQPYIRHPPGFPWLVGLSALLFGESEDSARGVPMLFTVLTAALLAVFSWRRGGALPGAATAAVFCLLPMTLFYGGHVDMQSSSTTFLVVASVIAWTEARRGKDGRLWALAVAALLGAMWSDWPGYLAAAVLGLDAWWRSRSWRAIVPPLLLAVGSFGAFLWWAASIPGAELGSLFSAAHQRSTGFAEMLTREGSAPLWRWFQRNDDLLPWWTATAALALGVLGSRKHRLWFTALPDDRAASGGHVTALLWIVGGLHLLLFPVGALIHEYWAYLLAPPLALSIGWPLGKLAQQPGGRPGWLVAGVVVLGFATWGVRGNLWLQGRLEAKAEPRHARLGQLLALNTDPDDRIATNGPYNPFLEQQQMHPQLTYYSDRKVKGGIQTEAQWQDVVERWKPTRFLLLGTRFFSMDEALLRQLDQCPSRRELNRGVALIDLD